MSDENAEGSWIPSLVVSVLIIFWWISRSQSTRAVQIRRWYSVKVRQIAIPWLSIIMVYWFNTSMGLRDRMVLLVLVLTTTSRISCVIFTPLFHSIPTHLPLCSFFSFPRNHVVFAFGRFYQPDHHTTASFLPQRVLWKKKLGLRDESIYKNGAAGDGANLKHKRQG